ncbi:MAG: hypothetical protein KF865_13760 [Bdellovibrionaceae bacterium]|nr:hypothetical protein [Pseudobdellovibrionaceae bacterium]
MKNLLIVLLVPSLLSLTACHSSKGRKAKDQVAGAQRNQEQAKQEQVPLPAGKEEEKPRETVVQTLRSGQSMQVRFLNPDGSGESSLVHCLSADNHERVLSDPQMGGFLLAPGTRILVKNDTSNVPRDETTLKGDNIQFDCQER